MSICRNNPNKKYTGKENTPLGLGYCSSTEKVGTIMEGKNGMLYIVNSTKTGNKWQKLNIDFDNLKDNFYRDVYYPKFEKIDEETGFEEKVGGMYPFFIEGEKWPYDEDDIPLTFFCQFKDFRKKNNVLYRVFHSTSNLFCYSVTKIELNEYNLSKQIKIKNPILNNEDKDKENDNDNDNDSDNENIDDNYFPPYKIIKWNKSKELYEFEYILSKFKIKEDDNDLVYNRYSNSKYNPSDSIKLGGTAMFCQYQNNNNKFNNFFQISECTELPYMWGDSGIAHIYDNLHLDFDCY
jgi:hypothetical protein